MVKMPIQQDGGERAATTDASDSVETATDEET